MHYVSSKAKLRNVMLEGECIILGPSIIGAGSLIGNNTIIGYPVRRTLKDLIKTSIVDVKHYDEVSSGAIIGENCIIRSGSVIYERVQIGDELETGHNVLIRENTKIGRNVKLGTNTVIDGEVLIGSNVNIQSCVYIPRGCVIEDGVFIGPRACLTNDKYPPSRRLVGVVIKRGAIVGANSVLISGITVGEEAVIAAGAVVTKNVPPRTVVAGVPARVICSLSEYLDKKAKWELS